MFRKWGKGQSKEKRYETGIAQRILEMTQGEELAWEPYKSTDDNPEFFPVTLGWQTHIGRTILRSVNMFGSVMLTVKDPDIVISRYGNKHVMRLYDFLQAREEQKQQKLNFLETQVHSGQICGSLFGSL